jgi:hypothetical protein
MLSSHMFMKNGGILGFHCTYQYPQTFEGTYYYERYPLTLKGTDAVLFTLFRAFGLTVHIKAYERCCYGSADDATKRCRGFIATQDDIGVESEADVSANTTLIKGQHISDFERSYYVGDEIFRSVAWFNEWTAQEDGKEYHEVARPVTNWIGNETEIEWEYTFLALLVVVPEFSKRELKD